MLCKRTYKNQITLPVKIAECFEGVEYFNARTEKEKIILEPVKMTPLKSSALKVLRKKVAALGVTEGEVGRAVEWARKK